MAARKAAQQKNNDEPGLIITEEPGIEIEGVVTNEFERTIAEEAFMNEIVVVNVHESTHENDPSNFTLSVNGRTQGIFRGFDTPMRRMFVEVLARCKETKYTQHTPNPNEPDRIVNVPKTALAFPFTIVEDKNPKGRAWLKAVLAEAS